MDLNPDILIIDDSKARNEAKELGIKTLIVFTTDILKQAATKQMLSSYAEIMEELKRRNIFLPE